jgi:hypothetical protein
MEAVAGRAQLPPDRIRESGHNVASHTKPLGRGDGDVATGSVIGAAQESLGVKSVGDAGYTTGILCRIASSLRTRGGGGLVIRT